ncbi:hypothetical protein [Paenibacillus sp. IITD108]|uniref:hypothetical protein n=1 Tax=Paenibacillus sp. IITD108 TaxID=3116649 RepID=UPI002F42DC8D
MNVWFLLAFVIGLSLAVYAHHESSRAAYLRAKAREINLRVSESSEVLSSNPAISESTSTEKIERNNINNNSGEDQMLTSMIDPNWRKKWGSLSTEFNEMEATNILEQYEMDLLQDNEDFANVKIKATDEIEFTDNPQQKDILEVQLDQDAIQFLKQISGGTNVKDVTIFNDDALLEQCEMYLGNDVIDSANENYNGTTSLIGGNHSHGVYFMHGTITLKYDDVLVRIEDSTESKIISNERLKNMNVNDKVLCQLIFNENGWNCVRVWLAEEEEQLPEAV